MTSCFCLPFRKDRSSVRRKHSDAKSYVSYTTLHSSSEKIDIIFNEGANLQDDLWNMCFREKLRNADPRNYQFYQHLSTTIQGSSYATTLQNLEAEYTRHGLSQHVPQVRAVLDAVQPFAEGISTMVDALPSVAGLVWGSTQIVLEALTGSIEILESVNEMMQDLSRSLPRIHAYAELLPTPRLHKALRDIYSIYVDFCITTATILQMNSFIRLTCLRYSSIARDFESTQSNLKRATSEFDSEAQLANAQSESTRHQELLSKLSRTSSSESESVTSTLQSRNLLFTGREDILHTMETALLCQDGDKALSQKPRRSCVLYASGGMGKTQIALEFAHRYMDHFTHIFWVHAESEAVLANSFLRILDVVGIPAASTANIDKKFEMARDYLQGTSHKWLLIYDNVESAASIQHAWPGGKHGTIIVTTQIPDFGSLTMSEIQVPSMSKEEGSDLIRRHLRRGGSEHDSAELLSVELGGMPLAIAHFAGYVARSQCPLDHILETLQDRLKSSQIWSQTHLTSVSSYHRTLQTVWDLALSRLTSDALELLEVIAFLEADHIPEEMFVNSSPSQEAQGFSYWDMHRFNQAVGILRERNLIERFRKSENESGYLRTHRTLQKRMLHQLDLSPERRHTRFDQAVSIVRQAFPRQNLVMRASTADWPVNKKYISHITSINTVFVQSNPKMKKSMIFAELLRDGSAFLFNWHVREEALFLLGSAEEICESGENKDSDEALKILPFILSDLGMYDQYRGIDGRESGVSRTGRALALYEEYNSRIPPSELTQVDIIAIGRFNVDHACCWLARDDVKQAGKFYEQGLKSYQAAGTESDLKVRFGTVWTFLGLIEASKKNHELAREWTDKGWSLVVSGLGIDHHFSLWIQLLLGMCAFTRGDIASAIRITQETLDGRLRLHTQNHHEVLSSRYLLAVAYQRNGDLELAEEHLREIIQYTVPSLQWRKEDIARANYRLSILLRQQRKPREAEKYSSEALLMRKEWETQLQEQHRGEEIFIFESPLDSEQMTIFDLGVCAWHGRTTGKWAYSETTW